MKHFLVRIAAAVAVGVPVTATAQIAPDPAEIARYTGLHADA